MKKLQNAVFLIVSFSAFSGQAFIHSHSVSDNGLAVVEVEQGGIKGNGTLVIIDGELRVLTNAHILPTKTGTAHIVIPRHQSYLDHESVDAWPLPPEMAYAVIERYDALADIAVLKLITSIVTEEELVSPSLKFVAENNAVFCIENKRPCQGENLSRPQKIPRWSEKVHYIDNYRTQTLENLYEYKSSNTNDLYISGLYDYIYKIPFFARPGMSGSPFYKNMRFSGLLTKIEMDATGVGFVIPAKEIAKVLAKKKPWQDSSIWRTKYTETFKEQKISPIGGSTGDVGGSTGDVGNTKVSSYWQFDSSPYLKNYKYLTYRTPTPFRKVQVNKTSFLRVQIEGRTLLQNPTSARFLYYLKNGLQPELVQRSKESTQELIEARKRGLNRPLFHRIYKRQILENQVFNNFKEGFIQKVEPFTVASPSLGSLILDRIRTSQSYLQVKKTEAFHFENTDFIISSDFKSARLLEEGIDLQLTSPHEDLVTLTYGTKGEAYRIAVVYNDQDLTKIERIFVETLNYLEEWLFYTTGENKR